MSDAPKVQTYTHECQIWQDSGGNTHIITGITDDFGKISNITHTYTITDGRVTACDTIIHD